LIAPDKILTAAHCLSEEEGTSCENTSIVFGYSAELNKEDVKKISSRQVYHCQKLMEIDNYKNSEVDYAILKLDRPVEGVEPVVIVKSDATARHEVRLGDAIYTVGYPIGTPKKIARGKVRRLHQDHDNPQASLDVYYGNSGSPIFNTATNELVGLLSNGEQDFVMSNGQCQQPKRCSDNGCLGEAIVPVNKILKKLNPRTLAN
jgi:integrin beta 3